MPPARGGDAVGDGSVDRNTCDFALSPGDGGNDRIAGGDGGDRLADNFSSGAGGGDTLGGAVTTVSPARAAATHSMPRTARPTS